MKLSTRFILGTIALVVMVGSSKADMFTLFSTMSTESAVALFAVTMFITVVVGIMQIVKFVKGTVKVTDKARTKVINDTVAINKGDKAPNTLWWAWALPLALIVKFVKMLAR